MANDWLRYENQGATRNQPLSPELIQALSQVLPQMGIQMDVFSGGQPSSGPHRTGSHRHDQGNAADVFFSKGNRRLDWRNKADIPILQEIVQRGRQAGITGWGAGEGYMQPGSMHVGFGSPSVWGAGGAGRNAPAWLRAAYEGGDRPLPQQYALPVAEEAAAKPAMDGLKGAEQLVAADYSTRPQGPVEAAGGGRGSDPVIAPAAPLEGVSHPPNATVGTGGYVAPGANTTPVPADVAAKTPWWQNIAKNIGKMGAGDMPGVVEPAAGGGAPMPQAVRIDQGDVPTIDPQANEQQRQMLALAMQRLNSGRLF